MDANAVELARLKTVTQDLMEEAIKSERMKMHAYKDAREQRVRRVELSGWDAIGMLPTITTGDELLILVQCSLGKTVAEGVKKLHTLPNDYRKLVLSIKALIGREKDAYDLAHTTITEVPADVLMGLPPMYIKCQRDTDASRHFGPSLH